MNDLRDPNCSTCDALYQQLNAQLRLARDGPEREHVLAAVADWWVQQSLDEFHGDPRPLMTALEHVFHDAGILMSTNITPIQGQPS